VRSAKSNPIEIDVAESIFPVAAGAQSLADRQPRKEEQPCSI
jgi:hypothetical protein